MTENPEDRWQRVIDEFADTIVFEPVGESLGGSSVYECGVCRSLVLDAGRTEHRQHHLNEQHALQNQLRLTEAVEQLAGHVVTHHNEIGALQSYIRMPMP